MQRDRPVIGALKGGQIRIDPILSLKPVGLGRTLRLNGELPMLGSCSEVVGRE